LNFGGTEFDFQPGYWLSWQVFVGKLWPALLGTLKVSYSSIFWPQQTTNAAYYSKLVKDQVKPTFHSK